MNRNNRLRDLNEIITCSVEMNSENFRSLGCVAPPTLTDDSAAPMNSFSVNQYGDVALLRRDGKVVFSTLNGDDKHTVYEKPIDNEELLISHFFTDIEFSEDGTILLLWSQKVGEVNILQFFFFYVFPACYCTLPLLMHLYY